MSVIPLQSQSVHEIQPDSVCALAETVPLVKPATRVWKVKQIIGRDGAIDAALVGEPDAPAGIVMSLHLDRVLSQKFGVSLFANKPIEELMDSSPLIVRPDLGLDEAARLAMARTREKMYDHLIVFDGTHLHGVVSVHRIFSTLAHLYRHHANRLSETIAQLEMEIANRRKIEHALRQSEQMHRSIFENTGAATAIIEADTTISLSNTKFGKLMGLSAEDAGRPWKSLDFFPEDEAAKIIQYHHNRRLKKGNAPIEYESRIYTRDGKTKDVMIKVDLIPDTEKSVASFIDISTIKNAEKRYRTLFESANDAILAMHEARIIDCNPKACRLFRCAQEDLIDAFIEQFAPQTQADGISSQVTLQTRLRNALAGEDQFFDFQFLCGDNQPVFTEVNLNRFELEDRQMVLAIIRDMSARQKAEAEQQELLNQLQQAHKMEAIGTLAGGIAHDFNNILAPIMGYTELLMDAEAPGSPTRETLGKILGASNRARELIEQILTFSRQNKKELRPIRPQHIVKEALKLIRASLPSTIRIVQRMDMSCGDILADPTELHQIVMNLCTNAFHAMGASGGILEVIIQQTPPPKDCGSGNQNLPLGAYLKMSVRDTGHGIDPSLMKRVFEPYFTTRSQGKGSGMGLAIVHGIVKSYHGCIQIRSQPGRGTIVEIFIPVLADSSRPQVHQHQPALPRGAGQRVLIVDDEESVLDMHAKTVSRLGYQVTACLEGVAALELFRKNPQGFDLIITDKTMPAMTGMDLAANILALRPHIPVVVCTGFADSETVANGEKIGIWKVLPKPISMQQLADTLRQAFLPGSAA